MLKYSSRQRKALSPELTPNVSQTFACIVAFYALPHDNFVWFKIHLKYNLIGFTYISCYPMGAVYLFLFYLINLLF